MIPLLACLVTTQELRQIIHAISCCQQYVIIAYTYFTINCKIIKQYRVSEAQIDDICYYEKCYMTLPCLL